MVPTVDPAAVVRHEAGHVGALVALGFPVDSVDALDRGGAVYGLTEHPGYGNDGVAEALSIMCALICERGELPSWPLQNPISSEEKRLAELARDHSWDAHDYHVVLGGRAKKLVASKVFQSAYAPVAATLKPGAKIAGDALQELLGWPRVQAWTPVSALQVKAMRRAKGGDPLDPLQRLRELSDQVDDLERHHRLDQMEDQVVRMWQQLDQPEPDHLDVLEARLTQRERALLYADEAQDHGSNGVKAALARIHGDPGAQRRYADDVAIATLSGL